MPESLKPSALGGSLLLATCLLLAGCSEERGYDLPPPLPPLPAEKEKQGAFLLAEIWKRLTPLRETLTIPAWRQLSWIHQKNGDAATALKALDRALVALNAEPMSTSQEVAERSSLADQYLLLGQTERARKTLGDFRYQGTSPKGQALLSRSTLTPLEETRLQSNDVFQSPNLVLMLADLGMRKELWKALQSRLEFSLARGPLGGRREHFHSALILMFHLGNPQEALKATERQSPEDQIRTLTCLLWGGTQRPSMILYQGDGSPAWEAPASLRPALRARLVQALNTSPSSLLIDQETSAGATLAALHRDFPLAECFARRLRNPEYRRMILQALTQQQVPLLSYESDGINRFERHSVLTRNLGQLIGIQDPQHQQRLLEQFLSQMDRQEDGKLFALVISNFLWKHKRHDLLAKLETFYTDPAFQVRQALVRGESALDAGKRSEALAELTVVSDTLSRIPKPSHRFQEGLAAQELARRLKDRPLMEKLLNQLLTVLPAVKIATLKNDGLIRLAGLSYLCEQPETYHKFVEQVREETRLTQREPFWTMDLLDRLAREQTRLGDTVGALECIQSVPSALGQVGGLLMVAARLYHTPPLPSFPVTPSLQVGPTRGLRIGP